MCLKTKGKQMIKNTNQNAEYFLSCYDKSIETPFFKI